MGEIADTMRSAPREQAQVVLAVARGDRNRQAFTRWLEGHLSP